MRCRLQSSWQDRKPERVSGFFNGATGSQPKRITRKSLADDPSRIREDDVPLFIRERHSCVRIQPGKESTKSRTFQICRTKKLTI